MPSPIVVTAYLLANVGITFVLTVGPALSSLASARSAGNETPIPGTLVHIAQAVARRPAKALPGGGNLPGALTPHAPFGSRAVRSHERYSWLSVPRRCFIAPKTCYLRPWSLPRCRTLVRLCGDRANGATISRIALPTGAVERTSGPRRRLSGGQDFPKNPALRHGVRGGP